MGNGTLNIYEVGMMTDKRNIEAPSAGAAALYYGLYLVNTNNPFMAVVYTENGQEWTGKSEWLNLDPDEAHVKMCANKWKEELGRCKLLKTQDDESEADMDKFEAYLEAQIAEVGQEVQRAIDEDQVNIMFMRQAVHRALEQALEAYRKHKAEQGAPVFRVGDRVLDNRGEPRTIEEYYEGAKQEDYVLARGGKFNDLDTFRVGQLTRIEESEEQS